VTPFVASFIAGLVTLAVGIVFLPRILHTKECADPEELRAPAPSPTSPSHPGRTRNFHVAFSGYYALILIVFAVYLTPLKDYLNRFLTIGLPTIATATSFGFAVKAEKAYSSFKFLTSPGTLIFAAAGVAYLVYRASGWWPKGGWKRVAQGAFQQASGATITVMTMSMMAVVMLQSGATTLLASGTAKAAGKLYPLFAPFIGQLGAFMTGSNTSSNILFTSFQQDVAVFLGIGVPIVLGLQTAGGATGTMICPMNIALGTGSTSSVGREGEILNKTLRYALIIGLAVGILGMLLQYVIFAGHTWLLPL
jgi:lactate permease